FLPLACARQAVQTCRAWHLQGPERHMLASMMEAVTAPESIEPSTFLTALVDPACYHPGSSKPAPAPADATCVDAPWRQRAKQRPMQTILIRLHHTAAANHRVPRFSWSVRRLLRELVVDIAMPPADATPEQRDSTHHSLWAQLKQRCAS